MLRDENGLPEPDAAWSPGAMLAFIYTRCLRRRSTATTLERQQLYEERLQMLCNVMNACKSGNQSVRLSAAVMARRIAAWWNVIGIPTWWNVIGIATCWNVIGITTSTNHETAAYVGTCSSGNKQEN